MFTYGPLFLLSGKPLQVPQSKRGVKKKVFFHREAEKAHTACMQMWHLLSVLLKPSTQTTGKEKF